MIRSFTPKQLQTHLQENGQKPLLLDVRELWEYQICHIDGVTHIPMGQIMARLNELDPNRETVVICHHGVRSMHVAKFLASRGFNDVVNLTGGVDGWAKEVDNSLPKY